MNVLGGWVENGLNLPTGGQTMVATGRHRLSGWLVLVGSVLLVLTGCNRFSWGPDGMRIAVRSTAPSRPPFDVEEALVLLPKDRPPEAVDHRPLQRRFSTAIESGLLPATGEWALVAWLLINRDGEVADVRVEQRSGDPNFDEVFSEGISLSRFRPAERIAAESPRAEPVSVWMEYPYSITWIAREPRGPDGVSEDQGSKDG
jgi:hypothetical protein